MHRTSMPDRPTDRPAIARGSDVAVVAALLVAWLAMLLAAPVAAVARQATDFPRLEPDRRLIDQTGDSLSSSEHRDLQGQLEELVATGADPVVLVRALDATPEQTLEQVEALQQAWVAQTGADQDVAVAILVNRDPDDDTEGRAGIFVGSEYDDGNVPRDEQEAIVAEALIPPLRDGDVHASLEAGIERLASSIRTGPPESAFERAAAEAGRTWVPWASLAVAVVGLLGASVLYRRRETIDRRVGPPTTQRPGDLRPAMAGALVEGRPPTSAVSATLLDLATRDAVALVPEQHKTLFKEPKVQVRLLDASRVRGDVEQALWDDLARRAPNDVVASDALKKLAGRPGRTRDTIRHRMEAAGWLDPSARVARAALGVIAAMAAVLAIAVVMVAGAGGTWLPVVGITALGVLGVVAVGMAMSYSRLSRTGQEAALPWRAYRDGLERAAKDDDVGLDLDATLPDLVAFGLAGKVSKRLEEAEESGTPVAAFETAGTATGASASGFPYWAAFIGSTGASGAGAAGVVSGAGAGGGGGAAGST